MRFCFTPPIGTIALITLITLVSSSLISPVDSPAKAILTADLKQVAAEHDTIIVGIVKDVFINTSEKPTLKQWVVVVTVSQQLSGESLHSKEVSIFIHSPTREFGEYKNLKDLRGRRCVWALKREKEKIVDATAPFQCQRFDESDLAALKRVVHN